jgi:hypothetical protein
VWLDLSQFLYRGGTAVPDRVRYDHPKPQPVRVELEPTPR